MSDIEIDTRRYEAEHGQEPMGRRFWAFTIVSHSVTTRDHFHNPGKALTYQAALEEAKRVAELRKSEKIIVMP